MRRKVKGSGDSIWAGRLAAAVRIKRQLLAQHAMYLEKIAILKALIVQTRKMKASQRAVMTPAEVAEASRWLEDFVKVGVPTTPQSMKRWIKRS